MLKKEWIEQGFIDEPFDGEGAETDSQQTTVGAQGTDERGLQEEGTAQNEALKAAIRRLCREKDAVILAHYYTVGEIQEVADFIGDSLALARKAAETDAKIIVMCGVHFMAETCKILSPEKLVLAPDLNAGCSLADSCKAEDLKRFKDEHPGYQVVSYVNTTAAVKALTDVVVTSGNAKKVVDSFPKDAKLIFGPDYNLGSYINSVTGREMLLWEGGCHVHERFSVDEIVKLKQEHPNAVVMAHLECKGPVLAISDVQGSTAVMLKYAQEHDEVKEFIVATEAGILHEMQRTCPDKEFYPVPPEVSENGLGCSCNECEYMKMNSLLKIYNALKYEWPTVDVAPDVQREALKPIERMLKLS
ncbi:MAG: quinolinate synthase NadA [Prevotella sp.]|nr:quinolinate synthase NadA [Prevotella sp.]